MNITDFKRAQLEAVARHREELRRSPRLRWLFFEITDRCNLHCRHCGSSCTTEGQLLSVEAIKQVLRNVREHSPDERPTICLTGGEPMLHPDFRTIAEGVRDLGFAWGMTTNATLIDEAEAERLKEAGMSTISVSLDGLEASHDALRQQKGAFQLALRGLKALQKAGFQPQVTTVMHRENREELEPLFQLLCDLGIRSWRPINMEPIGRACESGGLLLRPEQFAELLHYIREKRFDRSCDMEVTFGCSHYLGTGTERMVRDHYFLCGAGIQVAGIRSNGDISACLDVEDRRELVQGNIYRDEFWEVWSHGFQAFRRDRTADCEKCRDCSERFLCGGDSTHTWDFDRKEPKLCWRDYGEYLQEPHLI